MFARGVERRQRPSPDLGSAVFRCTRCTRPLELEQVRSADIERRNHAVTGYVVFQHFCACTPGGVRTSRSWATHQAFLALFGSQPWLPWRAPFRYRPVADDDPIVTRWRWELAQVADAHEFMLYLDDARRDEGALPPER